MRLCQGYCETPTIYNIALKRSLETCFAREQRFVTVCGWFVGMRADVRREKSLLCLLVFAEKGHKASKPKLQFVRQKVLFLGHILTAQSKQLATDRVKAIQAVKQKSTMKQMHIYSKLSIS